MASEFDPIVMETVPVTTVPHASAPVIEVRLAGAVVRLAFGMGRRPADRGVASNSRIGIRA
jgi:hypothetical protein